MASLIDSIREIKTDPFWLIKIVFFSAILFAVLYISYDYEPDDTSILILEGALTLIFLGCASVAMNRNINNKSPLFPGLFDILEVIIKMIGSTIAILPGLLIYYMCIVFVHNNFNFEPFTMYLIYTGVTIIFSSFIFVPVVLYSAKGKLTDAFNIKNILNAAGNFSVQFMSFIIQYILIFCSITLLIYFTLLNMLGDNVSLLILKCIVIVVSFFSLFLFCSDLYGEVIIIPEPVKKKKLLNQNKNKKRKLN
ncbi:MAG: hypothetical protein LUH11_01195 [Candidatus Gastranaerophilales bacterium]|nr:hypothetical protein [Candidatus Gastranaerophilales bacterium]